MCPQAGQSLANFAVEAIRSGDIDGLKQALEKDRDLVYAAIDGKRTLLHVATDWPGHFPNNAASVVVLIASGADVNATFVGTPYQTRNETNGRIGDVVRWRRRDTFQPSARLSENAFNVSLPSDR